MADEAFAQAERNRLEEPRVAALDDRLAADLDLGGHAAAVAELEELAGRYRFRERLHGLLMLALYRRRACLITAGPPRTGSTPASCRPVIPR